MDENEGSAKRTLEAQEAACREPWDHQGGEGGGRWSGLEAPNYQTHSLRAEASCWAAPLLGSPPLQMMHDRQCRALATRSGSYIHRCSTPLSLTLCLSKIVKVEAMMMMMRIKRERLLCNCFFVNFCRVSDHSASRGELLVADITFEMFRFLVLRQDLLILEFPVAVP